MSTVFIYMLKYFKPLVTLIFAIFVLVGCKPPKTEFPILVGPRTSNVKSSCRTSSKYSYLEEAQGSFNDNHVVIHSQISVNSRMITPEMVGEVAEYVRFAAENLFFYNDSWKHEAMKEMFKHSLIIVTKDPDHLSKLWNNNEKGAVYLGKTTVSNGSCFHIDNNTWFATIAARAFRKEDMKVLVHEMLHQVSNVYFGKTDVNHENPSLWEKVGGDSSLEKLVLDSWYRNHGS